MSRRDRGPRVKSRYQNDRPKGDRPKGDRSKGERDGGRPPRAGAGGSKAGFKAGPKGDRPQGFRPGSGKPPRFAGPRREKSAPAPARAEREPAPEQLPTKVQTVVVT